MTAAHNIPPVKNNSSNETFRKALNRRINFEREAEPNAGAFSQTIDIDLDLPGDETRALPNMPGYPVRSQAEAISHTKRLMAIGIGSVTYRLGGGLKTTGSEGYVYAPLLLNSGSDVALHDEYALIARHAEFYRLLRKAFPHGTLHIIADPFGVAPSLSDGAWGARGPSGEIDERKTKRLLEAIAIEFAGAGVDAILTMGRIEGEVEVTRAALERSNSRTEIYAFSQNSESKAAYVYLDKIIKSDSYQKILPGNTTEMKVRTILDIAAGADVIVVKPADNFHVIQFTVDFLQEPDRAFSFLRETVETALYKDRPDIRESVESLIRNESAFRKRANRVRVGTYTVSGTYFMDKLLERDKGESYLFNVEDERFRNIISILGSRLAFIIDRSSEWYVRQLRHVALSSTNRFDVV
ncbi:MAG: hypothetical protein C3F11_17680 [Methylocystaceae bacterium]|nr:MAG: hypothetical protein C3F11_17680 [Methylocystaceae bacterium]